MCIDSQVKSDLKFNFNRILNLCFVIRNVLNRSIKPDVWWYIGKSVVFFTQASAVNRILPFFLKFKINSYVGLSSCSHFKSILKIYLEKFLVELCHRRGGSKLIRPKPRRKFNQSLPTIRSSLLVSNRLQFRAFKKFSLDNFNPAAWWRNSPIDCLDQNTRTIGSKIGGD
jgi:hypothetical protein